MEHVDLSNLDATLKAQPSIVMREVVLEMKFYISCVKLLMDELTEDAVSKQDLPNFGKDFGQRTEGILLKLDILAEYANSLDEKGNMTDFP